MSENQWKKTTDTDPGRLYISELLAVDYKTAILTLSMKT